MPGAIEGGEGFSPRDAIDSIGRLQGVHAALRQRTSGVTWMIWGIATAAIFVTYTYVGVLTAAYAKEAAALFPFLWIPWTVMASIATHFLWKSAGLMIPLDVRSESRGAILTGVIFVGLIFASLRALRALELPVLEPAAVLAAVGLATALVGAFGVNAVGPYERRAGVVAGAALLAVAVVTTLLTGGDPGLGYAWFSLVAPAATATAYVTVGWLVATQG